MARHKDLVGRKVKKQNAQKRPEKKKKAPVAGRTEKKR